MYLIFLLLFLSSISISKEGPGWEVEIKPVTYEYYSGEPLLFYIIGKNKTDRELKGMGEEGILELDGQRCQYKITDKSSLFRMVREPGKKEFSYKKGDIHKESILLSDLCKNRFLSTWLMLAVKDDFFGIHKLCYLRKYGEYSREKYKWEEKEERFCTEFKIIYPPEGEREIYKKYIEGKQINDIREISIKEKLEIIKEYPTSIYTGWILAEGFDFFKLYPGGKYIIEKFKKGEDRYFSLGRNNLYYLTKEEIEKSSKEKLIKEEELFKEYIKAGERFIEKRWNSPLIPLIYLSIAYENLAIGDIEKFLYYGEKAEKMELPEWYPSIAGQWPQEEYIELEKNKLKETLEEVKGIRTVKDKEK